MGTKELPDDVVELDHQLDAAIEANTEELCQLRWHWTLNEDNPDRVSYLQYSRTVGKSTSTIRQSALAYEEMQKLASQSVDERSSTTRDEKKAKKKPNAADHVQMAGSSERRQVAIEALHTHVWPEKQLSSVKKESVTVNWLMGAADVAVANGKVIEVQPTSSNWDGWLVEVERLAIERGKHKPSGPKHDPTTDNENMVAQMRVVDKIGEAGRIMRDVAKYGSEVVSWTPESVKAIESWLADIAISVEAVEAHISGEFDAGLVEILEGER